MESCSLRQVEKNVPWFSPGSYTPHPIVTIPLASFLTYYDYANAGALAWIKERMKKWAGSDRVPAAFAIFQKDISHPPREWAGRFFNVQRWTEMPHGGHFAAMEEPELLAEGIRSWFRQFRNTING